MISFKKSANLWAYVTASCDQQNFRSFDNFLKNSIKSDVALKHDFTRYLPAKIIERQKKKTPRGGEKARKTENTYEKTRETPRNRKTIAYALISTVPIIVRTEPGCRSNSNIRTQGCAKPECQCHATYTQFAKLDFNSSLMCLLICLMNS